jgi:hypothetical protein
MIDLAECRTYLAKEVSDSLNDIELAGIRNELQTLAVIFVEYEFERR